MHNSVLVLGDYLYLILGLTRNIIDNFVTKATRVFGMHCMESKQTKNATTARKYQQSLYLLIVLVVALSKVNAIYVNIS